MEVVAAGLSFHTAPLAVREQAAIPDGQARTTLRFLVGHSGLREAAVLSTCNRTEFYVTAPKAGMAEEISERLARYLDPTGRHQVAEHVVTRTGAEAVRHMFRVAGGLDSMIIGEAQILGQFKAAHRVAREAGTLDRTLDFLMKRAVSVGKRVRTETGIGRGRASIGELAVGWAAETLGGLEERGVLLLGAGEIATVVGRRLAARGARVRVASRGGISAQSLAESVGGLAVDVADLEDVADLVDLVVCSTSSPGAVLSAADLVRFQDRRGGRPLAVLDIAVPRDVEPDAGRVPGVVLTDLDALGSSVTAALDDRRNRLPAAEALVDAEVGPTIALVAERDATAPTIAALVEQAEALRRAEVARGLARVDGVDAAVAAQVEALTRSLVRKLLHAPIAHLKDAADDPAVALLIREAFDLDGTRTPRRG